MMMKPLSALHPPLDLHFAFIAALLGRNGYRTNTDDPLPSTPMITPVEATNPFATAFNQLSAATSVESAEKRSEVTHGTRTTTKTAPEPAVKSSRVTSKKISPAKGRASAAATAKSTEKKKAALPRPTSGDKKLASTTKSSSPRKDANSTNFGKIMDEVLEIEKHDSKATTAAQYTRVEVPNDPWEAAKLDLVRLKELNDGGLIDRETYSAGADRVLMLAKIKELHLSGELAEPAYTAAMVGALTHSKVSGFSA